MHNVFTFIFAGVSVCLMNRVHTEPFQSLSQIISESSQIPKDLGSLIASFLGACYWSETIPEISASECETLIKKQSQKTVIMHNKVPVWNSSISAYTLEFRGRALLPSVHNFQVFLYI